MATEELVVDPIVSRLKFEREIAQYASMRQTYLRRGVWMLFADFPKALFAFAASQLKFPSVLFGALIDFSNYDLWAPSVTLVNPFNLEPYLAKDVPVVFRRKAATQPGQVQFGPGLAFQVMQEQPLLQWHKLDQVPFLCLAGVREYHLHPAHTGDPWLMYRGTGIGSLQFILEQLHRYGVNPITGYQFGIDVSGFIQGDPPE